MNKLLITFIIFLLMSCSIDPKELEDVGDYEKALIIYKNMLSEDYQNEDLRIKFTLCYFKNAFRYIKENNLEEAERNIERGIIYTPETNPGIKNQYAEIILILGQNWVKLGNLDGSVEQRKKYEKGYDLIQKAVFLLDDNTSGKKILDELNSQISRKDFQKSRELFFQWKENKKNSNLIAESLKLVENSLVFDANNSNAKELLNNILEETLFESVDNQVRNFKIMKIYHNTATRITAFKIRFYNDDSQEIIISPEQFTLYDDKNNAYKFSKESAVLGNYTGVFTRKKINATRYSSGLLVFNTGKKSPTISSLVWRSLDGETYEKEFPNKKILEIVNPK